MDTIKGYLQQYGDVPLDNRPLNHVDSLILCQFAYLKFDGLVPAPKEQRPAVSLEHLAASDDFDRLFSDERYERDNRALFQGMVSGRRFRNMRLDSYVNIVEKEWETQFSAVRFLFEDGSAYVAFRGTDENIVGWKEDFNMAFLSPVPGQEMSVKYLNEVMEDFSRPFYVGGHSKGGNLAIYSAMNCSPGVQGRIIRIYSMDGPGFRPEVLEDCGYDRIAERVVKLMPHSSVVGMLFEWDNRYQVVESKSIGLAQHNPYSWLVKNGDFVRADNIFEGARVTDNTINEWILSLNEEQLRTFVDTLYLVITASEADNLIAFTADWKKSMTGMLNAVKGLDEETEAVLREIIRVLFEIGKSNMRNEFAKTVKLSAELKERLRKKIEQAGLTS